MIYSRPTELKDLSKIDSLILSEADIIELELTCGLEPSEAILKSVIVSTQEGNLCYTILLEEDDSLVGFYGLSLTENNTGIPWLLASREIEENPHKFLRGSIGFIEECDRRCSFMTQVIDPNHKVAKGWLKWLGFTFSAHPSRDYLEVADRINIPKKEVI